METTSYFKHRREKPDRSWIQDEWIEYVVANPEFEEIQTDGRIRRWAKIEQANNRYLRVVILDDNQTVHNAFFDRTFGGEK